MKYFVGLDVHWAFAVVFILDGQGRKVKRTRTKNSLRGLLRSLGIRPPEGVRLWTRRGLKWLAGLELSALYAVRKKIAVVATAHYLVRVMHAMLRHGEAWREVQAA